MNCFMCDRGLSQFRKCFVENGENCVQADLVRFQEREKGRKAVLARYFQNRFRPYTEHYT